MLNIKKQELHKITTITNIGLLESKKEYEDALAKQAKLESDLTESKIRTAELHKKMVDRRNLAIRRIRIVKKELVEVESEAYDYRHFIELYELNDEQMLTISKQLQECLRKRRLLLDESVLISTALEESHDTPRDGGLSTAQHYDRIRDRGQNTFKVLLLRECLNK